eukprot:5613169-Amphidinium_carterae.1
MERAIPYPLPVVNPSVIERGKPISSACKLVLEVFLGSNLPLILLTQLFRHVLAFLEVGNLATAAP